MQLIEANTASFEGPDVLTVANDSAIEDLRLDGITTVLLHFPKFNDGRAFSLAFELRRRRGFEGRVIATGDVLVDQVLQMKRCGFSAAILRADQSLPVAEKLLRHYPAFYQGDVGQPAPLFARHAA